jgi:hypothetical protein
MRLYTIRQRLGQGLVAGIVATLTCAVVAQAVQTVTTPNAATFSYTNLGAGLTSAAFTPVFGRPVLVMGVNTTIGDRGVGQVTLLRSGIAPTFLEWTGLESPAAAAITSGFSGVAGTHIVFINFAHNVDIEVNTPDSIRVHNESGILQSGNVTLIW